MLTNVLSALRNAASVASVTVVCADCRVRSVVEKYGAEFLWEGRRRGLNGALNFAIRRMWKHTPILIIHADLPFLTSEDVDNLAIKARIHPLVFASSKDRTGTNAILMKTPNLITISFGRESFQRHIMLARKARIAYRTIKIYGVAFDVDDERDLDELIRQSGRIPPTTKERIKNQTRKLLVLQELVESK
jgi:2-phospho-L-lactate guanylyltransferase